MSSELGRVENLIKGNDGLVHGAFVKSITPKERTPTLLRRPLQKLFVFLELVTLSQEDLSVDLPAGTKSIDGNSVALGTLILKFQEQ